MKAIRAGICFSLAFAVLLHGAVEGWSEAIFEISAALLLATWAWKVYRRTEYPICWSPLDWPLAGLLLFAVAQLIFGWTVYPYLTKQELLLRTACFIYFFLCTQVFREKRDVKTLVWFLVILGFAVGLFGIVQQFTFNGKLYWIRELKAGGIPFGPFVNRNHFAGFMELIAPLGLALLVFHGIRREQMVLTWVFTVVQVLALIISASRGGILGFVFGVGLLLIISWTRKAGRVRLAAIVMVLLAAVALTGWLGVGEVAERFAKVGPGEVSLQRRAVMARGSWHIFRDHPWTGTGAGTLISVYPRYEGYYDGKLIEHSHNDYVELLADMGLPGGLLGAVFLLLLFRIGFRELQVRQSPFSLAIHAGAIAACGSLLLHSFVDFNLHIPSNAALFLVMAFLATSPALPLEEIHRARYRRYSSAVVDSPASSAP